MEPKADLSIPTRSRLFRLHTILAGLDEYEQEGLYTSEEISEMTGISALTLRKDISLLGQTTGGRGYRLRDLKSMIETQLIEGQTVKACLAGLGELGLTFLGQRRVLTPAVDIIAGFEGNTNRLERLNLSIPLYPAYDIEEVVQEKGIRLAVLTVCQDDVNKTVQRLVRGGIKGILNCTPSLLESPAPGVVIRHLDLMSELKLLSSICMD